MVYVFTTNNLEKMQRSANHLAHGCHHFREPRERSSNTEICFHCLVDSGADRSILPRSIIPHQQLQTTNISLRSANNFPIQCHCVKQLTFQLGNNNLFFDWLFLITDVSKPILGADFLAAHKIDIVCHLKLLRFSDSNEIIRESTVFSAKSSSRKMNLSNYESKQMEHLVPKGRAVYLETN